MKIHNSNRVLLVFLTLQTFAHIEYLRADTISVQINTRIKHQVIEGFGASDCWSFQKIGAWHEDRKNLVADLLFSKEKGIGLSQWRFNIGAGINRQTIHHPWRTVETFETGPGQYDWTRQEEERWFLDAARERGVEQFIAFVNSPTGRMTRNGLTNCTNGLGSTNLKDGWENQFARYLKDILVHFRDEWNLEFDYISPVNEPQWEWNEDSNQEGNRAANEDIRNIVSALYDSLQSAGLNTEILLVESGDLRSWYQYTGGISNKYGKQYGNYLSELMGNPTVSNKISRHIAGHSYWSDLLNTQLIQDREALAIKLEPYFADGWRYWCSEYCILSGPFGDGGHGRDLSMQTAINVARVMHYDLTILNASAWQWWTAVSPENFKDGLIYTDYMNNPMEQSVIESKLLWTFGNFSRFIRPGFRRVEMLGANDKLGLMGSAYLSPDEKTLVIVFINSSSTDEEICLQITGMGLLSEFSGYITSDRAEDDLRNMGTFSLDSCIPIPAISVVTLVGSLNNSESSFKGYNPDRYQLYQNFPNPFNESTNLCFNMPVSGAAELSIFSPKGDLILSKKWPRTGPGIQYFSWNARPETGKNASSGVYLYTLKAGSEFHVKKMLLIK